MASDRAVVKIKNWFTLNSSIPALFTLEPTRTKSTEPSKEIGVELVNIGVEFPLENIFTPLVSYFIANLPSSGSVTLATTKFPVLFLIYNWL